MVFFIVKDPTTSADELNQDHLTISDWDRQWKYENWNSTLTNKQQNCYSLKREVR